MSEPRRTVDSAQVARRYGAERRFRFYGQLALAATALFLAFLIIDLLIKAAPAFTESRVRLSVLVDAGKVDAAKPLAGDYEAMIRDSFHGLFHGAKDRAARKQLNGLISQGAARELAQAVVADPTMIGKTLDIPALLSDDADLYLKGQETRAVISPGPAALVVTAEGDTVTLSPAQGLAAGDLVRNGETVYRVTDAAKGLAEPVLGEAAAANWPAGGWQTVRFATPESERRINDRQALWLENLKERGLVDRSFAWTFFSAGDSREAELAGIRGALIGSVLTIIVTLAISLPIGVGAALYLEQFAPKNRITDFIEVNINNLAAVPSIIFGLLGLAIFLNVFGMPRSAPVVGGLVLALLVLPTIVIASRAAIRSVPPSISEAALGVGASHQQAVFHHVLPLALPGILTGTILGVARALGETAPLLMIGMVAFIADLPEGFTSAATVLPVQVFLWSDLPEQAFQSRTAAAIILLLFVLFFLNALAIYLRKRFERRW